MKKKLTNRFDTQSAQSNGGKQSWSIIVIIIIISSSSSISAMLSL